MAVTELYMLQLSLRSSWLANSVFTHFLFSESQNSFIQHKCPASIYTWTQVEVLLLYTQCSLHAENYSGTAGRMSSLAHSGTQFSTKDRDNDRCTCRCAQLASGGTLAPYRPRLNSDLAHSFPHKRGSFSLCTSIKPLLTCSCSIECHFSRLNWTQVASREISDVFLLQVGGLRRAAPPIWTAYTTPAQPARCATTASSGTTGRVPIWWQRWRPWWCAQPVSGGMMSDEA